MHKTIKKVRVECDDLMVGMYVCELDRPWLDSPFLLQGFYIKDDEDIDTVRDICDYVFVDKAVERNVVSSNLPTASSAVLLSPSVSKPAKPKTRLSRAADEKNMRKSAASLQGIEDFFPDKALTRYTDSASWREESRVARKVIPELYDIIARVMLASMDAAPLDMEKLKRAVEPMVASVIRNPDACLWSTVMKPPADMNYDSALRATVYAVVLGRQLGLPKQDLRSLAIGGLLFDIGKLRLDEKILYAERRLTSQEMAIMQRHVEVAIQILKRAGITDPDIIDFVAHHHERLDGSGYPQGLAGDLIPPFGRIAGLVDCYNAITGSRKYASSRSPAEAINQLYKLKDVHFHADLIDEFIQAIGVYPVGALVELSSGEVAIVVAQSRSRRLRPMIAVLLDRDKNRVAESRYIKLEEVTHSDDGRRLDIVKNLEPNAYGMDLLRLKLKH
jgi:HD-GYP domain-containing protein (c-di-GMP phosphodiesterase class II)